MVCGLSASVQEECGVEATPKKVLGVWNTFFPTSAWGGGTHTINVGVHLVTDEKGRDDSPMVAWKIAQIL
jgi:hypothetical protein